MSTNEVREAMIEWRDGGADRFLYVIDSAGGLVLQSGPMRDDRVTKGQIVLPPEARARLLALLAPEPEPSEGEIEAGAKALHARLWHEGASRSQRGCTACRNDAKAVLLAARAARQTGGDGNGE